MNIGTIVTPNVKGQIVIPKKIRDDLNISAGQLLNIIVSNGGIHMYPVSEVITQEETDNKRESLMQILKGTRGILKGKSYYKNEKAMRKLELEEAKKRKQAW